MGFLKNLLSKGKQGPAQTQTRPESKQAGGKDAQVDAVALVSDMWMAFDGDETFNNWVAGVLQSKWPGLKLPPRTQIEVAVGFKGNEDEARAKLSQMLQQVMTRAHLDEHQYIEEFFSLHSEVLSSRIWGVAAVRPQQRQVTDDMAHFIRVFGNHLQRIRSTCPQLKPFLDQYLGDAVITEIASAATDKMRLTRSDGEQHSTVLARGEVVYHITTLPVDMGQAREWFGRTAGSYTQLLEKAWNALLPKVDSSVWCHIIYGSSAKGTWVHMAICPVRQPAPTSATMMPIELLTAEERQRLGL